MTCLNLSHQRESGLILGFGKWDGMWSPGGISLGILVSPRYKIIEAPQSPPAREMINKLL